jgi:hypothetical protein
MHRISKNRSVRLEVSDDLGEINVDPENEERDCKTGEIARRQSDETDSLHDATDVVNSGHATILRRWDFGRNMVSSGLGQ